MKEIPLTKNMTAIVDDEDFESISKFKWCYDHTGYAVRTFGPRKKQKKVSMHREIMNADFGVICDHINGNKLDNRRENLRKCSARQNSQNRKKRKDAHGSLFKGVSVRMMARGKVFSARIKIGKLNKRLGSFQSEIDAALAYNSAAIAAWGEFAKLNEVQT